MSFKWMRCNVCGLELEWGCAGVHCEQPLNIISDADGEWPLTIPYPALGKALKDAVGAQAVIIHAMADQLMALRSIVFAMLVQASKDELSATDVDGKNPWFAIKEGAKKLMNPKIKELNALLGIQAESQTERSGVVIASAETPMVKG